MSAIGQASLFESPSLDPPDRNAHLADPLLQRAASANHVNTATITASAGPHYASAGPSPTQAPPTGGRMRSSIACVRCRRSKVKCVNSGVNTTCRACENSGRDCQYPPPIAAGSRRRESSISGKQDGLADPDRRPRPRKSAHNAIGVNGAGSRDSPRPLLDALDPRLLTADVWEQLFEIFETHYSADLPFLHKTTFLEPIRRPSMPPPGSNALSANAKTARPPGPDEFLLAFLALTARFHPAIVAHHSPATAARTSNPLIASEYYANAANERLLHVEAEPQNAKIEGIQAALMLGLHEWGMCRGYRAWIRVGIATRSAQAMGLQYETDLDDEPNSRSMALNFEAERMGLANDRKPSLSFSAMTSDDNPFVEQEIRRRTFWSCYVMDRYLSSGKYRPQMLHARELRIQLPASERTFLFGNKVRTMLLTEHGAGRVTNRQTPLGSGVHKDTAAVPSPNSISGQEDGEDQETWEVGPQEGLVSRYMRILEIYGKVVQWSCAGGRRIEEHPPWDHRSEFYRLLHACYDFKASLPREDTLTPQHTRAHISVKDHTPYALLHTVYLLCQVMLHREYVPFIPLRSKKPEGPLDPPLFPPDKYDVPTGFWEDSARQCFKAARDIMDLVRTCDDCRVLVETPIVGFAIYTVSFVGVYCINFPWMDPDGYMCTPRTPHDAGNSASNTSVPSKGFDAARKALEMILDMKPRLHMAAGWSKTINRMHKYFRRIRRDYEKNVQANESMTADSDGGSSVSRQLSLREGGAGGGLEEYRLIESTLQSFGDLEDHDVVMGDARSSANGRDMAYDDSPPGSTVKGEEGVEQSGAAEQAPKSDAPWNAINTTSGAANQTPAATPTTNGQFRSYESYQQPTPAYASNQPPPPYQPQHVNNFRPAYMPPDGSAPGAGAPGLTSPNSRTASTNSHPSPSYDHRHNSYGAWTPHQPSYGMHPTPQAHHAYPNGTAPPHAQQAGTPVHMIHAYPTPGAPINHGMAPQQPMQEPPQIYDPMAKEAWLNSVSQTGLSGDDVAVFADGGEMTEWAARNPNDWLGQIYGHQY